MVTTRTVGLGKGLHFDERSCIATCRIAAGVSKGDVVMFDTDLTDGDTNDNDPGESDSGLVNVIAPATALLDTGFYGVAAEDAVDNADFRVVVQGRVKAQTTGTPADNVALVAANGVLTLAAAGGAGGEKILGVTLEAGTSSPTWVVFDGINGLAGKDTA